MRLGRSVTPAKRVLGRGHSTSPFLAVQGQGRRWVAVSRRRLAGGHAGGASELRRGLDLSGFHSLVADPMWAVVCFQLRKRPPAGQRVALPTLSPVHGTRPPSLHLRSTSLSSVALRNSGFQPHPRSTCCQKLKGSLLWTLGFLTFIVVIIVIMYRE